MTIAASEGLKIDILVESNCWKQPTTAKAVLRRALREAAAVSSTRNAEVSVVLTDDASVRLLNRQWRDVDKPTNVLSFPTAGGPSASPLLGDVVLAYETIAREAHDEGKPFAHHLAHLAVHGFLHLLGYDHERSDDANEMEGLERRILRRLAIPDPYRSVAKTTKRGVKKKAEMSAKSRASLR